MINGSVQRRHVRNDARMFHVLGPNVHVERYFEQIALLSAPKSHSCQGVIIYGSQLGEKPPLGPTRQSHLPLDRFSTGKKTFTNFK